MNDMERARSILRETFGYHDFRHRQADIIAAVLHGRDVLALMPTGGGKSLCYQIPALVRPGAGIVVSPLIALMQDQVDALRQLGLRAAFLNSSQSGADQRAVEAGLRAGELDLLYVAPERLLTGRCLDLLAASELALFAIDEAHCVSQWGHDFRPEYRELRVLGERFSGIPRMALTATADPRTREEIVAQLGLEDPARFVHSFDRPNIHYAIHEGGNARDALWRFLEREHPEDAGIVYCLSRKRVEEVARWLQERGRTALPYHAGLSAEVRREHQERFLREDGIVMVATIAFGMGIDKPDVRFVAHLNLPRSVEAYYQETGRAGRDGAPAHAWMAYQLQDVITLRRMTRDSEADEQYKRSAHHRLEAMLGLCELSGCRRQALLAYFGEERPGPCGNCDNCQQPPETWDATLEARQALSCVYRTGQRFGVNYVIDVLLGKDDERIRRNGHQRLSTFGIGAGRTAVEWRSIFRQLVARGYLEVDLEGHGGLRLAAACRPLLRGEEGIELRRPPRRPARAASRRPADTEPDAADGALFEALRGLRRRLAEEQGVPPYVVFHDATLREMASRRPATLDALGEVGGVGARKLERYGPAFLELIAAHEAEAGTGEAGQGAGLAGC